MAWRTDHPMGPTTMLTVGGATLATVQVAPDADHHGAPVVLVPGFTGSKADFAAVVGPIAAAGHHVVACDLPGQDESPDLTERRGHGFDDWAAVVADLCAHVLAVHGRRPHLLGHSMGGLVARAAVLGTPTVVASLVVLDSGPAAPVDDGTRARRRAAVAEVADDGMAAIHARLVTFDGTDPRLPDDEAAFLDNRFVASSAPAYLDMYDALLAEPDRVEDLRATGVPILVVRGEHDRAWPPGHVDDMAVRLGGAPVVIPDADHSPALENPFATVAALLSFWADVETPDP